MIPLFKKKNMIPVRENSEVVIIYPDIFYFPMNSWNFSATLSREPLNHMMVVYPDIFPYTRDVPLRQPRERWTSDISDIQSQKVSNYHPIWGVATGNSMIFYVSMYLCMYACMHVCMYASMYLCMYVCT